MDGVQLISQNIGAGKDVVIGEHHDVIGQTFSMMKEVVEANPGQISAISLELPPEIQNSIVAAQNGEIDPDTFRQRVRIEMEQAYISAAQDLLEKGRISQEDYDRYEVERIQTIEDVMNGTGESYDEQALLRDQEALGPLYELSVSAGQQNIPVLANDVNREFVVLMDLGQANISDWIERLDDTSDYDLLGQAIDLTDAGPILAHRGVSHLWDISESGQDASLGLDDALESAGRDVVTVGHYSSVKTLSDEFNLQTVDYGLEVNDPTDYTIIRGQAYETPDIVIAQTRSLVPQDTLSP